jgi:hypothetical protein
MIGFEMFVLNLSLTVVSLKHDCLRFVRFFSALNKVEVKVKVEVELG